MKINKSHTSVTWLLLFGLIVLLVALNRLHYSTITPTAQCNIQEFSERVHFSHLWKYTQKDQVRYLAMGEPTPVWVLPVPSGSPLYVFDPEGKLVEWIEEYGNSPKDRARWDLSSCQEITLEQVLVEIRLHPKR